MTYGRGVLAAVLCAGLMVGCAADESTKRGAATGAAVGAGIGLLIGVLSGDSDVAARAMAIGAASGASRGAYEGWRQGQDDRRTQEITKAIRESSNQQANLDAESRQREELTRFLGVWQMTGWVAAEDGRRIEVSSQLNGNPHMNYFVELAYIDLKAEGLDGQIWGTTTLGYDADSGFELSTRFNTLPDAIEVSGGTFDRDRRSFDFSDSAGRTTIRFETPDRFVVETTDSNDRMVESYRANRV